MPLSDLCRNICSSHRITFWHPCISSISQGQKRSSSPLPFLPPSEQQVAHSILDTSTLLSSLSISATPEFKGRRKLSDLLLPETVLISQGTKGRRSLSEKVCARLSLMTTPHGSTTCTIGSSPKNAACSQGMSHMYMYCHTKLRTWELWYNVHVAVTARLLVLTANPFVNRSTRL